MPFESFTSTIGFCFFICLLVGMTAYFRIKIYLAYIDSGLENPPDRPRLSDKLIAYRDFCREREQRPVLLYVFGVAVILAVACWLPLPWMIFVT